MEEKVVEGTELVLLVERGRRWGEYRKHPPCLKAAGEKRKSMQGTKQKMEKGERRGFKFHQDSINRRSTESETPQLDTWQCSSGKGKSPGAEREVLRVLRPHGERRFP